MTSLQLLMFKIERGIYYTLCELSTQIVINKIVAIYATIPQL